MLARDEISFVAERIQPCRVLQPGISLLRRVRPDPSRALHLQLAEPRRGQRHGAGERERGARSQGEAPAIEEPSARSASLRARDRRLRARPHCALPGLRDRSRPVAERTGQAEQRKRGRAQASELPEPVERAVDDPVGEPGKRRCRHVASERIGASAVGARRPPSTPPRGRPSASSAPTRPVCTRVRSSTLCG